MIYSNLYSVILGITITFSTYAEMIWLIKHLNKDYIIKRSYLKLKSLIFIS